MDERIPAPVRPILERYRQLLEARLPGLVQALYLHGSVALDAFSATLSDVDFVAVVGRRPAAQEVEQLRVVHELVLQEHPRPLLDGIYLPEEDVGHSPGEVAPHLCFGGHILHQGALELNPVTCWVLKKRGVTVFGPPAETLPLALDVEQLLHWMRGNLNSFWVSYTRRPKRIAALWTDWGIEWAVLGVLRQFYTFREHDITSKTGAGQYALSCLPARWHRLVREAIQIREGGRPSLYRFRLGRAWEALGFLKMVIANCNGAGG